MEKTFAIIKPHAVKEKNSGKIIDMIESAGFDIICMDKIIVSHEEASELYKEHAARPFYSEMILTLTASPVIILMLSKENAVQAWRDLIGATDPLKAAQGTIRARFGANIGQNAVHGSDSVTSAQRELDIFFPSCTDGDACCAE